MTDTIIPTFADIDFGLPGGDLHPSSAASRVTYCKVGKLARASVSYAFAGVDGYFQHDLGARGRTVTWDIVIRTADLATLNQIERAIEAAMTAGVGELKTTTGRIFARAMVKSYQPGQQYDIIRSGEYHNWIVRESKIEFEVLSGD